MPKKEDENKNSGANETGLGQITRRAFTIGSVAAIGSSPLIVSETKEDPPPFKLEISEEVHQILVDRHVLNEDLIKVIRYAEKTGEKLYRQDCNLLLAKLKMNTVYFYVEYSPVEGGYRIHNTYTHRFTLEGTM